MKDTTIKSKKVTFNADGTISGILFLSDKSKVNFKYDANGDYKCWGNLTRNFGLVTKLLNEFKELITVD